MCIRDRYTRGNAVDVIWALLETKFKSGGKKMCIRDSSDTVCPL